MASVTRKQPKPQPLAYGDGSIFQRKSDGRWIVRVHQDGKYVQIGSSMDPDLARNILDGYKAGRAAGLSTTARDWLTVDWLEYWLSTKQPRYDRAGNRTAGVQPTTFEKYETQIRRHIVPYIGKVLPPQLVDLGKSPETILRWQHQLNASGLGADVQIEALQRLSTALDFAVGHDLILRNPADRKRGIIQRPERPLREHVKPSELDLVRLLRAIRGEPLEALVWIAMGAGFRRGEVAGLEWADVRIFNDEHGEIRAHQRVNRVGQRAQVRLSLDCGRLEREGLKSKKQPERVVTIGAEVIRVLRQRWQVQLAERTAAGNRWRGPAYIDDRPTGYLFTKSIGTPIEPDKITKFMADIRERAGLDIKRFHGLRRVFATLMNKTGAPDRVTMESGGWADLDMTHYYQDPMASQKLAAAQALDAELGRLARIAYGSD
jgi:integrase